MKTMMREAILRMAWTAYFLLITAGHRSLRSEARRGLTALITIYNSETINREADKPSTAQ